MSTIGPIETHYAGYRFRSRLEARWAVFFETLGVAYQYESQGYLLGDEKRPYLPDFWLPGIGAWVEVKGEMAAFDMRLADLAVSRPGGLPYADPWGELSLLVLGPIPEPGIAPLHWQVSRTVYAPGLPESFCACRDLHFSQQAFRSYPQAALDQLTRIHGGAPESPGALLLQVGRTALHPHWDDIVSPRPCPDLRPDLRVDAAYRAARSARFEHGEMPPAPLDGAA